MTGGKYCLTRVIFDAPTFHKLVDGTYNTLHKGAIEVTGGRELITSGTYYLKGETDSLTGGALYLKGLTFDAAKCSKYFTKSLNN